MAMEENSARKTQVASWRWPAYLQGITIATILGGIGTGGIWVGHIETKLEEHTKALTTISNDLSDQQQGLIVKVTRVDQKLDDLTERVKELSPKIVRKDFEEELNRLNARVDVFQKQVGALSRDLESAQTRSGRYEKENMQLHDQIREVESQLAEITSAIDREKKAATSEEARIPEPYQQYIVSRLEEIEHQLDELQSRLRS